MTRGRQGPSTTNTFFFSPSFSSPKTSPHHLSQHIETAGTVLIVLLTRIALLAILWNEKKKKKILRTQDYDG